MNTEQACRILGVEIGCSTDEVDKAFKKMAVKYHPDKNKDNQEEAEEKFKEANSAYQFLKEKGTTPFSSNFTNNPIHGFNRDFINDFFGFKVNVKPMRRELFVGVIDISFIESVTGCKKEVLISVKTKCTSCNGSGITHEVTDVKCKVCNGDKHIESNGRRLPCRKCGATGFERSAKHCSCKSGFILDEKEAIISIPAGVESGSNIRVKNQDSDYIYRVSVEKDAELYREGSDVISHITIPLIDALKGCSREVRTAYGFKTLKIKPGVKNKDSVMVKGFGVARTGAHIFKVSVEYPDDTSSLIEFLETQNKNLEEIGDN